MEGTAIIVDYTDQDGKKLQVFTEGTFSVAGMVTDLLIDSKANHDNIETITIHPAVDYADFEDGSLV